MRQISLSSSIVFSLALWHRCSNVTDVASRALLWGQWLIIANHQTWYWQSYEATGTLIFGGGAANWRKIVEQIHTKLNIYAPHDAEIPLLRAQQSTREKQECVCSKTYACVWSSISFIRAQTETSSNIYQLGNGSASCGISIQWNNINNKKETGSPSNNMLYL